MSNLTQVGPRDHRMSALCLTVEYLLVGWPSNLMSVGLRARPGKSTELFSAKEGRVAIQNSEA